MIRCLLISGKVGAKATPNFSCRKKDLFMVRSQKRMSIRGLKAEELWQDWVPGWGEQKEMGLI